MSEELKQAFDQGWRMAAEWANRDDLIPDMDSPHYAKERSDRLASLTTQPAAQATPEPVLRFCPGCGSVGDVPDTFRDCCPDGAKARLIPASLAHSCHDLFTLALGAAQESATPEPVRPLFAAIVAARKWAELQAQGHRMQALQFDGGPGGAGSIDPWGKVTWATPEPVDDFFVLDDDAKAMIVNSHHYTPADIRALIERFRSFADPEQTDLADWDNLDWRALCNVTWRVMMGLACDLPPSATPEPVGEALQFPQMPEGWPARFRCDSCDGNGEIGELVSMGHFQPPERQTCPDCGGRGWTSEEHAFNADHLREFAEAHALLTRPAPGVPEGLVLMPVEPTQAMLDALHSSAYLPGCYRAMLAAAQAKGGQ